MHKTRWGLETTRFAYILAIITYAEIAKTDTGFMGSSEGIYWHSDSSCDLAQILATLFLVFLILVALFPVMGVLKD